MNSGNYKLSARTASSAGGGAFNVLVDGEIIATFDVNNTGGYQNWETLPAQEIYLEAGVHELRLEWTESGSNLNWLQFSMFLDTELPIEDGVLVDTAEGQTVGDYKANFSDEYGEIVVVDQNGAAMADDAIIGTGCEVQFIVGGEVADSAVVLVNGDVDGNGYANIVDLTAIKSGVLGKTDLEGVYFTAADYNGDGAVNIFDLVSLKLAILNG